MINVIHFVGPTPYGIREKALLRQGWRQEYLRPHNSRSTVRKLVRDKWHYAPTHK